MLCRIAWVFWLVVAAPACGPTIEYAGLGPESVLPAIEDAADGHGDVAGSAGSSDLGPEAPVRFDSDGAASAEPDAFMRVRGYEDREAQLVAGEWTGPTFDEGETPSQTSVAMLHEGVWYFSDSVAAEYRINSDATGNTGQTLAEWAPAQARFLVVRIVPLAEKEDALRADDGPVLAYRLPQLAAAIAGDHGNDPPGTEGEASDSASGPARPGAATGVTDDGSPEGHRHGLSRRDGGVSASGSIRGQRQAQRAPARGYQA